MPPAFLWKVISSQAPEFELAFANSEGEILPWAEEIHSVIVPYLEMWTEMQVTKNFWGKQIAGKRGTKLIPGKDSEGVRSYKDGFLESGSES